MAVFVLVCGSAACVSLWVVGRWVLGSRWKPRPSALDRKWARRGSVAVLVFGTIACSWGRFIEPYLVKLTHLTVETEKLAPGERFVLCFVTDAHIESFGRREEKALRLARETNPDLILLGGDYLNNRSARAKKALARFLKGLEACAPLVAVKGNWDLWFADPSEVFARSNVVLVERRGWRKGRVVVRGVPFLDEKTLSEVAARMDKSKFNICLHHSPCLVEEASRAGFDLYLCGHTHGGQVRLPFYGALVTLSRYGKRFELGRYEVEGTTAYVSSGLGLEGGPAPRVRFLCRPEVVVVEVVGAGGRPFVRPSFP